MIDKYKEIISRAVEVKEQRGTLYRTEPKDIVPIEVLEAVALLKAFRGYEGLSIEKKIDEYTDLLNYSAFIIERLQDLKSKNVSHIDVRECMTSSQQTLKVVAGVKAGFLRAVPDCFGTYSRTKAECMLSGCEHIASCIFKTTSDRPAEIFPDCFGKHLSSECIIKDCQSQSDCKIKTREMRIELGEEFKELPR
jgi:hypothetical protein